MNKNLIQNIRGMNDYLPEEIITWQNIEHIIKNTLISYGYNEIRFPIVEKTALFKRSIGITTDIISKEMYIFKDRNGDNLALRPEGTASCIRACIKNGLIYNNKQKLWYIGPMFRYERPQKGRFRQFHQIGAEVFGYHGPDIDAEIIMLTARLWKTLGIIDYVSLEINSIGSKKTRINYNHALFNYLSKYKNMLDYDYWQQISINPIRILDTKNTKIKNLLIKAPLFKDYQDIDSINKFNNLCNLLNSVKIKYNFNTKLVRGLDYYNDFVFEWVTNKLGSQGSICGGGRYDKLVKELGGKNTPAIGFAIGLERLVLLINLVNPININNLSIVTIYFIILGSNYVKLSVFSLAEHLRNNLPFCRLLINFSGGSCKKQLKLAIKQKAQFAIIIGEKEINNKKITIKNLKTGIQTNIDQNLIIEFLKSFICN